MIEDMAWAPADQLLLAAVTSMSQRLHEIEGWTLRDVPPTGLADWTFPPRRERGFDFAIKHARRLSNEIVTNYWNLTGFGFFLTFSIFSISMPLIVVENRHFALALCDFKSLLKIPVFLLSNSRLRYQVSWSAWARYERVVGVKSVYNVKSQLARQTWPWLPFHRFLIAISCSMTPVCYAQQSQSKPKVPTAVPEHNRFMYSTIRYSLPAPWFAQQSLSNYCYGMRHEWAN